MITDLPNYKVEISLIIYIIFSHENAVISTLIHTHYFQVIVYNFAKASFKQNLQLRTYTKKVFPQQDIFLKIRTSQCPRTCKHWE